MVSEGSLFLKSRELEVCLDVVCRKEEKKFEEKNRQL